jgi:hypothetical protein
MRVSNVDKLRVEAGEWEDLPCQDHGEGCRSKPYPGDVKRRFLYIALRNMQFRRIKYVFVAHTMVA